MNRHSVSKAYLYGWPKDLLVLEEQLNLLVRNYCIG